MLVGSGLLAGGLVWWLRRSGDTAPGAEAPSQAPALNQQWATDEQVSPDDNPGEQAALNQQLATDDSLNFDEAPQSVEPAPASSPPSVTARPTQRHPAARSADDWDTVDPEQLGEAFLTRATDSTTDAPDDEDDGSLAAVWKTDV